ncbi:unnamed protein product [Sphenostylis stenocarpa]|uniref:Uncharacterized protein n=1 Tax=Sphenostylis stenocarpa TaxID=92480 RepID=A0AA86VMI7_9FABA|nr:unnamed protein product [Sphenostylis stenocarpa]
MVISRQPLPIYEKILKALKENYEHYYQEKMSKAPQPIQTQSCMMLSSEEEFPSLRQANPQEETVMKPFIYSKEVTAEGSKKPISQAEEVLNWQTKNALAQNSLLQKIERKMDRIELSIEKEIGGMNSRLQKHYAELKEKIERLEEETRKIKETRRFNNLLIEKERELQKTREQYEELIQYVGEKKKIPIFEDEPYYVRPSKIFPTISRQSLKPTPLFPPKDSSPRNRDWFKEKRKEKETEERKTSPEPIPEPSSKKAEISSDEKIFQDAQDPYSQYTIHHISSDDSIPSSDEESVESYEENTETEEAEVNHTFMANDTDQPFAERTRLHNQEVNTPHPTNNISYPLILMQNPPSSSNPYPHNPFPPEIRSLQNHQIPPKQNWFNPDTPFLNIFAILIGEEFTEEDQCQMETLDLSMIKKKE